MQLTPFAMPFARVALLCGVLAAAAPLSALAQAASTQACEKAPGAAAWMPCGPDRVFKAEDLVSQLFKPATVLKMVVVPVTGTYKGKTIAFGFFPDGRFEAGIINLGGNIGKSWRLEGDKLCRVYQGAPGKADETSCGTFEVVGKDFYMVGSSGLRTPVLSMEFLR